MNCLAQGSCEWQNPFNAAQRQTVRFDRVQALVFWSKNPAPLIPHLQEIAAKGWQFYFQFTLNNYPAAIEPGLPPLKERLETFIRLAASHKVVWRYDPVIMGGSLTVKSHLATLKSLIEQIGAKSEKLVFSFVDLYKRAAARMRRLDASLRRPTPEEMREFTLELIELRDRLAPNLRLAACAEPETDFNGIRLETARCIDPELINSLCRKAVFPEKLSLLGKIYPVAKGQRQHCLCAPAKDIGSYRLPCRHRCLYCYAGHAHNN